jgi:diguanylate cyclase (GGDEF)-like protein
MAGKQPVALRTGNDPDDLLSEAIVAPGQQIVFVPVQSFQKVVGIAGLLADESNSDMRDSELLVSLGSALGVALESVRYGDELRILAAVDDLTNVYNRRYFFDQLGREMSAARRYNLPLSVLVLDLDGLKLLNDNFGHGLGDEALRTVAQRLVRFSRASDIVARLGGDEFAVILPRTDRVGAREIGHRLKTSVEGDGLATVPGREIRISVSCGWASFREDADDIDALLRQGDGRMYAAKAARSRKRYK